MTTKPWLKHYQPGVPHEINLSTYASVAEIFDVACRRYQSAPSFYCMGTSISYEDLHSYATQFGSYLINDLKLAKGSRVAIMMPNLLQYPIVLFGALKAGMIVVNVNPLYTPRELEHQLVDSGAETIVIVENFAHTLQAVIKKTKVKQVVLTSIGEMHSLIKRNILDFVIRNVKKMVPPFELDQSIRLRDAMSLGARKEFVPAKLNHDDIAFLQYTGGTTGVSKGAMLTHGNIVANVLQAGAWVHPLMGDGREIVITALPLYHIFSLTANCLLFMAIGGKNILITNPRDVPGFIKELRKHRFSAFTGINTLFNALLNNSEFATLDFSNFKLALGGGMAVQKAVADKWHKTTGVVLIQAYGLTETSPAAAINPMNSSSFTGAIGLPISSTDVRILDDQEKDVPMGQAGELCIRGPQVMAGYWNRPDETAKVMTADGWLKTGDIASCDEEGLLRIVDRKKDMILVSGFNVYPNEIEDVVALHPKVLEVAAVGVPNEKSGEVVKVFVVKKQENLTEEEVIAHCRENLTGYKVPKIVEFRHDLPKTNVGKILRRELR
ncbi:MAG: AMP-binding protein [Pseudomonadota bacterium]